MKLLFSTLYHTEKEWPLAKAQFAALFGKRFTPAMA